MRLWITLATAALLAACASAPDYYVMRHLQKADGQDPALSELGRRKAENLPYVIGDPRPRAIYVSATRRARETAAVAAERFGIAPQEYDPRDTSALIARARRERGPVLIVGHSNTVPEIVTALSGRPVPPMSESDYGLIYYVRGRDRAVILNSIDRVCAPAIDQAGC